jgi:hypothetical protein
MTTIEEKVKWADEQVKHMEYLVKGFGFDAIQAKVKLQKIRSLSKEEYVEAAIIAYDVHH